MTGNYRFYRGCYRLARALFGIFYRIEVSGRANIPESAAVICGNHSSVFDPVFVAFAFGIDCFLHFVAKVELFKTPLLSSVVKGLGAISVNREISDIATIKNILACLKSGEKVGIFPEGTRSSTGGSLSLKCGAVKIAERAKVPLVPVYIPRHKPLFSKIHIIIGEMHYIGKPDARRSFDDYYGLTEELMREIESLGGR